MRLSYLLYQLFNLVEIVLLIGVFLSWVPNLNRYKEPFKSIFAFTDMFFAPFRKIIPTVGMFDLSPIGAFICLGLLQRFLCGLLASFGL